MMRHDNHVDRNSNSNEEEEDPFGEDDDEVEEEEGGRRDGSGEGASLSSPGAMATSSHNNNHSNHNHNNNGGSISRQRRLAMNRESARNRRKRKKNLLEGLEGQVEVLVDANQTLRSDNADLRTKVELLQEQLKEARREIEALRGTSGGGGGTSVGQGGSFGGIRSAAAAAAAAAASSHSPPMPLPSRKENHSVYRSISGGSTKSDEGGGLSSSLSSSDAAPAPAPAPAHTGDIHHGTSGGGGATATATATPTTRPPTSLPATAGVGERRGLDGAYPPQFLPPQRQQQQPPHGPLPLHSLCHPAAELSMWNSSAAASVTMGGAPSSWAVNPFASAATASLMMLERSAAVGQVLDDAKGNNAHFSLGVESQLARNPQQQHQMLYRQAAQQQQLLLLQQQQEATRAAMSSRLQHHPPLLHQVGGSAGGPSSSLVGGGTTWASHRPIQSPPGGVDIAPPRSAPLPRNLGLPPFGAAAAVAAAGRVVPSSSPDAGSAVGRDDGGA